LDKYVLAGVGTIRAFTQSSTLPELIFTSKTLQENSISIEVSSEDVRGGLSNPLLSRYFHDSLMSATITDALFNLQYLALNVGGNITIGGSSLVTESVTTTVANQITITGTPVAFGTAGTVGFYTIEGQEDYKSVSFVGKTANVSNLPIGSKVCVTYNTNDDAMQTFTVPSAIIPSEVHLEMTYPLFAGGITNQTLSTSSQVGELIVDIPRFQLSGSTTLSMTASGVSNSSLSGQALASYTTANCSDMGMYGTVKMKIYGKNWSEDLESMAVDGAEISMNTDEKLTLKVVGIFSGGITGVLNNSNLTFTSGAQATATVSNVGEVEAKQAGTTIIEITATDKPDIKAYAEVTVK
jgi:hypothetical protein